MWEVLKKPHGFTKIRITHSTKRLHKCNYCDKIIPIGSLTVRYTKIEAKRVNCFHACCDCERT